MFKIKKDIQVMKKIYVMPSIEEVKVKMESALAAGTNTLPEGGGGGNPVNVTTSDDGEGYEGGLDANGGGMIWDD